MKQPKPADENALDCKISSKNRVFESYFGVAWFLNDFSQAFTVNICVSVM